MIVQHGDCLELLRAMPDNSVDAIVTDPPYGLGKEPDAMAMLLDWMVSDHHEVKGRGFMGKEWDAHSVEIADARVLQALIDAATIDQTVNNQSTDK